MQSLNLVTTAPALFEYAYDNLADKNAPWPVVMVRASVSLATSYRSHERYTTITLLALNTWTEPQKLEFLATVEVSGAILTGDVVGLEWPAAEDYFQEAVSLTPDQEAAHMEALVNKERDARIAAGFAFNGTKFDFDADSVTKITGAGASAGIAAAMGAQAGNLRWASSEKDFTFITADNVPMLMDAPTCFAMSQAAMRHTDAHIHAARTLKDLPTIPADYAADTYWPVPA